MFDGFTNERIVTSGAEINFLVGGDGPPLLLLHGYPQSHVMWHRVAPRLAERFTVVCSDLRGYGDSSKPPGGGDHATYSKRAMAEDQAQVMEELGFRRFSVAGHDRGGRVAHRMALDYPESVQRLAVLDIAPTHTMFRRADMDFGLTYYHWFFLAQPYNLPERLIGADPDFFLEWKLGAWGSGIEAFDPEALAEYKRCFSDPATIHASCEDYRAAASIDLRHDEEDLERRVDCPLLALWGDRGFIGRSYDVLEVWREKAERVEGRALPSGHFLPEEAPEETLQSFLDFF